MIEIKSRWGGRVLYTAENAADIKAALEEAARSDAVLRGAVLSGADLRGADLRGAVLSGAVLRGAVLSDADLSDADLRGADLRGAVLRGAVLSGADLRGADLRGAVLSDAVLSGADLSDADLRGADLRGAVLSDAVLSGAVLSDADLSGAVDHHHALWGFKVDLFSILDMAPREVAGLRAAIANGKIDGSVYTGDCACLVGTIANVRHVELSGLDIPRDASRPAEQWFIPIREGDVPVALSELSSDDGEGVFRASWALVWVDEWVESRTLIAATLVEVKAA